MKSFLLFFILLAATAFGQEFEPVPQNPQEIVRFKGSFNLTPDDSLITFKLVENERKLLIVSAQKIQIFDVQNNRVIEEFDNKIPKIESLVRFHSISPDGQKVVSLDPEDNRLSKIRKLLSKKKKLPAIVWELKTAAQVAVLEGETKSIRRAIWSDDGKNLVTSSDSFQSEDNETEICFWNARDFTKRRCELVDGRLDWNAFSNDGKRFFAAISNYAYGEHWITIRNTETATLVHRIKAPTGTRSYSEANLSPNERFFAIETEKSVEIWELDNFTKKFEVILPRKSSWIAFGSFSPDEKYIAVKNGKNGTEIYETADGSLKQSIPQNESVPGIWADDGRVLINSFCGEASGYGVETRNELYKLKLVCKTTDSINDEDLIILHPGTKYFLTKSGTAVRIWNARTGELLQTVVNPSAETAKRQNPRADDRIKGKTCFWSADGKYLYVLDGGEKSVLQYEFAAR